MSRHTFAEPTELSDLSDETATSDAATGRRVGLPNATWLALAGICAYVLGVLALHFLGLHVTLPNETTNPTDPSGGIAPAARELLGRAAVPTDFYADYASAHALTHGRDAYAPMRTLFTGLGPAWDVPGVNPHPPTTFALVLPFTLLHYGGALTAWALAMILALIATLRLVGVRLSLAVGIGIGLAITFPGAYGIANPVAIIGLGVALAYRYRDRPAIAGLGIALAAAPKGSGLILAVPFLAAGRIKTVVYAAVYYCLFAAVPVLFQSNIWQRYLKEAPASVRYNENRPDSGSLLRLAHNWFGWPAIVSIVVIGIITVAMIFVARDLFWPPVWAMVAALPIAWMYSLLTLVPLVAWAVTKSPRRVGLLAAVAAGITIASPPVGLWTPMSYALVVVLTAAILVSLRATESTLWFASWMTDRSYRARPPRADEPVSAPA
jgi:hypothetical protein